MEFKSIEELLAMLESLRMIGFGSQGTCYLNKKTGEVYKIFNQFIEDFMDDKIIYTKKELSNNYYVFVANGDKNLDLSDLDTCSK